MVVMYDHKAKYIRLQDQGSKVPLAKESEIPTRHRKHRSTSGLWKFRPVPIPVLVSGVLAHERDLSRRLGMLPLEAVPFRIGQTLGAYGFLIASNPCATRSSVESVAGPEGRMLLDADPLKPSLYLSAISSENSRAPSWTSGDTRGWKGQRAGSSRPSASRPTMQ